MKLLLENKFMEQGLWEVIHTRIGEWADRLAKAAEDQEDQQLASVLYGRPPRWWNRCLYNGFTGGHLEGGT